MKNILFIVCFLLLTGLLSAQTEGDTVSRSLYKAYIMDAEPSRDTTVCYSLSAAVTKPTFVGGREELIRYVNTNIVFPQSMADTLDSIDIFCRTIINRNGKVILQSSSDYKNNVLFEKVRVLLETMPLFIPGTNKTGKADFKVFMSFCFTRDTSALNIRDSYFIPIFPTDNEIYQNLLKR